MKVSELTIDVVANFIRVDITSETEPILNLVLKAAIQYCMTYVGIDDKQELDEYEDMTIAVLSLCGEFYDNRTFTAVENAVVNPTAQAILDKYSFNLL
nr:MAG TPA: head tail connector [Caudoviricetes sp.]DAY41745.1 MAG TPA: head tail connector [Caudoviricetes sp.]